MTDVLDQLRFGTFTLDLSRCELLHENQRLVLRRQAFDTLRHLVEHNGQVVAKKDLISAVWTTPPADPEASLVQCIKEIRKALGDEARWMIRTVPGAGYEFKATVEPPEREADQSPIVEPISAPSRMFVLGRPSLMIGSFAVVATMLGTSVWLSWTAAERLKDRNAERESYRYQPIGGVPSGVKMTIRTDDGRSMTCVGGVIGREPRRCWWN